MRAVLAVIATSLEGTGFARETQLRHRSRKGPWTGLSSIGRREIFVRGAASLSQEQRIGQHPGTWEEGRRAPGVAKRIDRKRSRPIMFDISCGDDGGLASCGIFGGSVGGGASKQPQTLAGLLKKLDLSEYEPKFVAAGITDVR